MWVPISVSSALTMDILTCPSFDLPGTFTFISFQILSLTQFPVWACGIK